MAQKQNTSPTNVKVTYNIVPNTENIISSLIDNINNNDLFQKNIVKLESGDEKEKKKATLIKKTISNIRVFNTKIEPLFLAKDIGILLGISHIKILIKKFEKEEKVVGYITNNNKKTEMVFLTKLGIYRCFYASRTPLAKLFRKFIGNIVDHMVTNESKLLKKISEKFQIENPELIEQGMTDLHEKVNEYEQLLLKECEKNKLLESQCDEERKKRMKIEEERLEVDVLNSFNMMHIEQLRKEKCVFVNKLKSMKESLISDDDDDSIDMMEIRLIKEKYMKPLFIYIMRPDYFAKLLQLKKKEIQKAHSAPLQNASAIADDELVVSDDDEQHSAIVPKDPGAKLAVVEFLLGDNDTYKRNFEHIFSDTTRGIQIENNEILYYYLGFTSPDKMAISKKKDIICVNTQWVANKKHFANTIDSLNDNCESLKLGKYQLYKTSIDDIHDTIREEFVNL